MKGNLTRDSPWPKWLKFRVTLQKTGPGLITQDVLFGDFGEAAVLPCFGADACKELFGPVGPASTTEPFLGQAFMYPPLGMGPL